MFEYTTDEIEDAVPLTHEMATRTRKKLSDVRKNGDPWWFRAHGKTLVVDVPVVLVVQVPQMRKTEDMTNEKYTSFFMSLSNVWTTTCLSSISALRANLNSVQCCLCPPCSQRFARDEETQPCQVGCASRFHHG